MSKISYNYSGKACKPSVTVKDKGKALKKGKDYTVKYSNNTNPGTATVTIKGKGKYAGSVKRTFKIVNTLKVTISKKEYDYTGKAIKPKVTVKSGKKKLTSKQYSVTYKNNKKVGTAAIIVKGKGAYKGKNARISFKILGEDDVKTGKLTLDKSEGVLLLEDTYKIKVLSCQGNLKYSSGDSQIAVVDESGIIKALGEGSTEITVKDSKSTARIKLKVVNFEFSTLGEKLTPGSSKKIDITRGAGASEYSWESDNTEVATVDQNGLVTAVIGNGGKANIRLAVNTLNGISYSKNVEIEVSSIADIYTVKKTGSSYTEETATVSTAFTEGQSADLNLVEGGLTTAGCDGDAYWHNTGLSTVNYGGYNYYFVSDTWNNRVLVYKVPENKTWGYDSHSVLTDLYCILGQDSANGIEAGYELNRLNWPVEAVAAVVGGKLNVYVTDTNNNRILVWNDLFTSVSALTPVNGVCYGPAADYSIMEKCDTRKVAFNEGNLSGTKMVNDTEAGIKWPWAIWTDGTRLMCTSTQDGYLLIWDSLPSNSDKYPDKIIYLGGTIRTIACKGNYVLLGDHNIDTGDRNIQGLKIIEDYSSLNYKPINSNLDGSTKLFDYVQIGNGDTGYSYYSSDGHQPSGIFLTQDITLEDGSKLEAGTLLLNCVGSIQVRKSGKIDNNDFYYIGGGVVEDTRIFRFTSADYAPVIVDKSGNMYVSMGNTGIIAGYKAGTIPASPATLTAAQIDARDGDTFICNGQYYERDRDTGKIERHSTKFPNVWLGTQKVTDDAYKETYRFQNSMVSSDGKHLVATSDHGTGSVLMLWKNIPAESNAIPDTVYTFTLDDIMNDSAIYNDGNTTMLMAGGRVSLFIWKDINRAIEGGTPDIYYREKVGSVQVSEIQSFAYDGRYFYLSDNNGLYIFDGIPTAGQAPVSTIDYKGGHINVTNCNDGETYIGIANSNSDEKDGGARIYTRTSALSNGSYYFLKGAVRELVTGLTDSGDLSSSKKAAEKMNSAPFNGPSDVLVTKEGKVIVSDTAFYRVIIWNNITEAVNEGKNNVKSSTRIVLGYGTDYYDRWDVLKADSSNYVHNMAPDEISMESPTTLFRPTSLAYDGNYLWIGDFKFSGGIKRFAGKFN